jgi:hypothetical protein
LPRSSTRKQDTAQRQAVHWSNVRSSPPRGGNRSGCFIGHSLEDFSRDEGWSVWVEAREGGGGISSGAAVGRICRSVPPTSPKDGLASRPTSRWPLFPLELRPEGIRFCRPLSCEADRRGIRWTGSSNRHGEQPPSIPVSTKRFYLSSGKNRRPLSQPAPGSPLTEGDPAPDPGL